MDDNELKVRASLDDELSGPLDDVRDRVKQTGRDVEDSGRRASRAAGGWATFGRVARRAALGAAAGIGLVTVAAAKMAKSSIRSASDLGESVNAVNVTWGKQAKAVKQLGRQAAKSMGLSRKDFHQLSVQFSAFSEQINGGAGKGSVKILKNITQRAADFASVMNMDVNEAVTVFQSGLSGETEPLRRYGIDVSAAAVQTWAYANGIAEAGAKLTTTQKVQATYGIIMEKTRKTAGDFKNTSKELANQERILAARYENSKAKLGRGLLPMQTAIVRFLNREGIPAFNRFSDWFAKDGIPKIQSFIEEAKPVVKETLPAVRDGLQAAWKWGKKAGAGVMKLVDAFNAMPSWAQTMLVGGVLTGAAAKKLGVGKAASVAGGLVRSAKPVPVIVMNKGWGPGGGPGGKPGSKVPPVVAGGLGFGLGGLAASALGSAAGVWGRYHAGGKDNPGMLNPTTRTGGVPMPGILGDKDRGPAPSAADVKRSQEYRANLYHANVAFQRLPKRLQSKLALEGVPKTQRQVKEIAAAYDLTRGEVEAVFVTAGIREVTRDVATVETAIGRVNRTFTTRVDADTSAAEQRLRGLELRLNGIGTPTPGTAGNGLGVYRNPGAVADRNGGGPNGARRDPGPVLTGPRTAAPGGGVNIQDGAIRVDARGASAGVDVTGAVKVAIEEWVREREERR